MEVYIEKKFIDNFETNLKTRNPTISEQIIINILQTYGGVDSFLDAEYNTKNELRKLLLGNEYLMKMPLPPLGIKDVKTHFFKFSKCKQTILLLHKTEEWFDEAEKKGALCLSLENFEGKILELKENLESLDIDVDEFKGWNMFEFMRKIPFNRITICDNYILTNKKDGLMDRNIIPLLKVVLKGKADLTIPVKIMTLQFNDEYPYTNPSSNDKLLDLVKKRFNVLNRALANYGNELKIINTKANKDIDFHRRELVTNFFVISPGKGFNLVPLQDSSNEAITVLTIFNKKDYMRINKRMNLYKNHEDYLTGLGSKNFQYYPESN